jgi:hypothetical protein
MGLRIKGLWRALPLALLVLVASACQLGRPPEPSPQEREAAALAERNRRDQERCLRDRDALRRQLDELRFTQQELARVSAEVYVPESRPRPIDPALAARFSQADQELDSIRHQRALERWRDDERRRYGEWMEKHTSLQQRLELREREQLAALKALNSSLFEPNHPNRLSKAAVAKYSSCDPELF